MVVRACMLVVMNDKGEGPSVTRVWVRVMGDRI